MQCPNDPVFGVKWYIVPLFVIWLFLIVNEIRQKRFSVVFGAAAFWLWDVFNETWNAMVYATTGQPVWGTTAAGGSALQILVGGIMANSLYRADFMMMNMKIQCNVISEAYAHRVKKLLFLGSTCIYPKNAPQPMKEDCLLTSELEYTNEEYALAKISGLKMCESYNLQYFRENLRHIVKNSTIKNPCLWSVK